MAKSWGGRGMANGTVGAVLATLRQKGYPARTVPVRRLADLRQSISELHRQGLLSDVIYEDCRTYFQAILPESLPDAASIVVVAVPQPKFRMTFQHKGSSYGIIVPPHYDASVDKVVRDVVDGVVGPLGFRLQRAVLPIKRLAVCSGLADYGRNNITYADGLGSFHRLVAFFTDAPLEDTGWREPAMLEQCRTCSACVAACPTGAITKDRFLIRAEICLTFHNEHTEPFPEWIDPSWHNSLIGCMHCQDVCPADTPFRNWVEDTGVFTETETALLLTGTVAEDLPEETRDKLARLSFLDDAVIVERNLRVLLAPQLGIGKDG